MKMQMGTLVVALLLAAPAAAQRPGPGSPGEPGRFRGRDLDGEPPIERSVGLALERRDSLQLTDEQVQQLEALRTEMRDRSTDLRDQMRDLRENAGGDRGAVRDRMEEFRAQALELREGQRGRFEDILSQEQRDQLGELMQRSRSRRPEARGRGARDQGVRRGAGGPQIRAYLQGLRDGLQAGARFGGGRGRPSFGPGR